ncbi:hypothetical protein CONCODRAFT_86833 [Conidiobolus coronatus NRRL 28638]|uniref:Uncharacterized protein n=1 Tax=Conidiobolus coronatus (strain ATCC 28846 / CBS 209.66 / NRRL 28638) TaxID=796925 RepID=A0A137NYB5_CONC2|nr:hypothetical protein CONCODRAFT_86833 [Conidiobolus coronatus NRRL 28638]|eukprot:KXN67668.1 hypothetical protein CONCODRAFT_86833 [Conidiobolus coronatus NRRL 28638]
MNANTDPGFSKLNKNCQLIDSALSEDHSWLFSPSMSLFPEYERDLSDIQPSNSDLTNEVIFCESELERSKFQLFATEETEFDMNIEQYKQVLNNLNSTLNSSIENYAKPSAGSTLKINEDYSKDLSNQLLVFDEYLQKTKDISDILNQIHSQTDNSSSVIPKYLETELEKRKTALEKMMNIYSE